MSYAMNWFRATSTQPDVSRYYGHVIVTGSSKMYILLLTSGWNFWDHATQYENLLNLGMLQNKEPIFVEVADSDDVAAMKGEAVRKFMEKVKEKERARKQSKR